MKFGVISNFMYIIESVVSIILLSGINCGPPITTTFHCIYISQRWARAYRDSVYHAAVETNNGAEALNRLLKYAYLPKQRHMILSHIISSITNQFLPSLHYKYVFKNSKQSDIYRSYNPTVVPTVCIDKLQVTNFLNQT